MNTSGITTLVISVYKKYSAVQLKIFPETKIKPFELYRSAAQFEGAAQIE